MENENWLFWAKYDIWWISTLSVVSEVQFYYMLELINKAISLMNVYNFDQNENEYWEVIDAILIFLRNK